MEARLADAIIANVPEAGASRPMESCADGALADGRRAATCDRPPVLAVDLDGTLLRGDTLHETIVQLALSRPGGILTALRQGWRGKAALKQALAGELVPAAALLPWDDRVITVIRAAQSAGRRVVLVTAAPAAVAEAAAAHIGVSEVLCTRDGVNLSGRAKRDALDARFGSKQWDYLGNAKCDVAVWSGARTALAANAPGGVLAAARRAGAPPTVVAAYEPATPRIWARALRVHQWSKNVLVLLPALLAHRDTIVGDLARSVVALVAFSLVASTIYLFNDLADLAHDRQHATKRHRPLAAGRLPLAHAVAAMPVLIFLAALLAAQLPLAFGLVLTGYLVLTLLYSTTLKRRPIVDVIVLAALYLTRLLAGSAATGIPLSAWLAAFALFVFLSLALAKRAGELSLMPLERDVPAGRGYVRSDLEPLTALGAAAAYTAVLVFALYLEVPETRAMYERPILLWGMVPLLVYWLSRLWLLVRRGFVHEDPVIFALKDRVSRLVAVLLVALALAAL